MKEYIVGVDTVELLAEEIATKIPPEDSAAPPADDVTVMVVVAAGTVVKTAPELVVKALGMVVSWVSVNVVEDTNDPVKVVVAKLLAGIVEVEIG